MQRALEVLADAAQAIEEWRQPHGTASSCDLQTGRARDLPRVHALRTFLTLENEIEIRAADLLVDLSGESPWRSLGFAGLADYAQERLGWGATRTYRRVRLARKVRELDNLRRAYETGRVGVEAATWVVRHLPANVVDTDIQENWVHHAEFTTVKRLRDEDRLLFREECFARARTALQVSKSVHGGRRQAENQSGRRSPIMHPTIPQDAAWRSFINRAPGRSQHLILELGAQLLERLSMHGALADLPLSFVLPGDLATDLWGCIESARADLRRRAAHPGRVSVASEARLAPSERIARDYAARNLPLPHWVGLLALLEDYVRTWDEPTRTRAHHAIHNRDGWRCAAPGCTSRRNLQTHHIQHRARGGGDESANLQDLCAFHHLRGVHGDLMRCSGRAPLDVVWRLGVRQLNLWFQNERRIPSPFQSADGSVSVR